MAVSRLALGTDDFRYIIKKKNQHFYPPTLAQKTELDRGRIDTDTGKEAQPKMGE